MKTKSGNFTSRYFSVLMLAGVFASPMGYAAIALDRTRVILNGSEQAENIEISNNNK